MRFSLFILFFFSLSFALNAQETSLKVIVTDSDGAIVPNVIIFIESQENNFSRIRMSDSEGKFVSKNLPFGKYKIRADHPILGKGEEIITLNSQTIKESPVKIILELEFNCDETSDSEKGVSDADKSQVLKMALLDAIEEKYGLFTDKQRKRAIIVSTDDVNPKWLDGISNKKFKLLSQKEIQQKADGGKDFLYVSFSDFKVKGNCILVSVSNIWAVGKNSEFGYLSGGGNNYIFQKKLGKWIKKYRGGWIS